MSVSSRRIPFLLPYIPFPDSHPSSPFFFTFYPSGKLRKVRCDAHFPSCGACRRTAKFEGRDPADVVCNYQAKRDPKTPKNQSSAKAKGKASAAKAEAARRSHSADSTTSRADSLDAEGAEISSLSAAKRRKQFKVRGRKSASITNMPEEEDTTVVVAELETRMGTQPLYTIPVLATNP